jgi:hypothetical protein
MGGFVIAPGATIPPGAVYPVQDEDTFSFRQQDSVMTSAGTTIDSPAAVTGEASKRLVLLLLGGLLIGLATSLPLAVVWPDAMEPPFGVCLFGTEANPQERIWLDGTIIPLPCMPTFLFVRPAVLVGFLGAGAVFGLIARRLAGGGSSVLLAVLCSFSLLILSFLGAWLVPRLTSQELSPFLSSGVAGPFAAMIFGIVFPFALLVGLMLRTPGSLWRAFLAAAATALCYWTVMWLLLGQAPASDAGAASLAARLPKLGNGMGPMMTTVLVGNLIAGTMGGWVTLALQIVRRRP